MRVHRADRLVAAARPLRSRPGRAPHPPARSRRARRCRARPAHHLVAFSRLCRGGSRFSARAGIAEEAEATSPVAAGRRRRRALVRGVRAVFAITRRSSVARDVRTPPVRRAAGRCNALATSSSAPLAVLEARRTALTPRRSARRRTARRPRGVAADHRAAPQRIAVVLLPARDEQSRAPVLPISTKYCRTSLSARASMPPYARRKEAAVDARPARRGRGGRRAPRRRRS